MVTHQNAGPKIVCHSNNEECTGMMEGLTQVMTITTNLPIFTGSPIDWTTMACTWQWDIAIKLW